MKTKKLNRTFLAALLAMSGIAFQSCSSDDDQASTAQEKDAVDAITYSLSSESNGLAKQMETASDYAANENLYGREPLMECGISYNNAYQEGYDGVNYSYNYSISRTAQLSCTAQGEPSSLSYSAEYSGMYDTPRMTSDDDASANWTLSGLDAAAQNAVFDGSYLRNGTQVSKVRNQNSFESTLHYDLDAIQVSKATHHIVSGSASVSFLGQASTGNTYSYNGTVTFNGNGTATLVLNGNTYTINL